ncbi:metalloregulator ArsR/SmtB family transcription factor [Nocardia shimofusensis]|uniref:metalloregulator ArsR/SmtB family transcription factor n=1 Tax=Nocardia shimofusensis TaxID=228596 RepID=UPI00082AC35E|nr:metalloregulator ArsR/SmtB family transcription factor [Nocardia shimofusensis]
MDEVAAAIADPVRRQILELLLDQPRTAGEIAGRFAISRPAISRHLRVLRESGLVRDEATGRQRLYSLDPGPLAELAAWIADLRRTDTWSRRFDALDTEVHRARRDRHAGTHSAAHPDTKENTA